ncbi:MAG: glutaminyl-peptide cyclotransferase [Deltaproteobacteria bacterium]|jgi:glutaminyl-peptide cyclotransferase|nr:glutaminyl-peptide cyclotransferase [Deltaproteobacteria bacterium]
MPARQTLPDRPAPPAGQPARSAGWAPRRRAGARARPLPAPALAVAALASLLLSAPGVALGWPPAPGAPSARRAGAAPDAAPAPVIPAGAGEILRKPPRFTQGLFFAGDLLYESSGLYGESRLTVWRRAGGGLEPEAGLCLSPRIFAEGAALAAGEVFVLTWRENAVLRFGADLSPRGALFVPGQGWGLAWDGETLWRSDGTSRLHPHDPAGFAPKGPPLEVSDAGKAPGPLNELEYDPRTGLVLANVYMTDRVAAIDLETGLVRFWLDLSALARPLRMELHSPELVLNGLAVDGGGRLYATGKMWDRMFEILYALPEGVGSRDPPAAPAPGPPPAFDEGLRAGCPGMPSP